MKPILLIGRGGHALSCLDVIRSCEKYEVIGYVDANVSGKWEGLQCLGTDTDLPRLLKSCPGVVIGIGQIGAPTIRRKVIAQLESLGAQFPVVIAPTAYVAPEVQLGAGTIVMHGAHIGPGVKSGTHNIFNTRSLVEHGCQLGSFIHVATAAVVNGDVTLEDDVFVGSNSTLCQSITVPRGSFVQAGTFIGRKHVW